MGRPDVTWASGSNWGVGETWRLAKGLSISAHYDAMQPKYSPDPPYVANVFGLRLRQRFASLEEAKGAAEKQAKKLLAEATKHLIA